MTDAELIHQLRNPHGHSQIIMRLAAADRIESLSARLKVAEECAVSEIINRLERAKPGEQRELLKDLGLRVFAWGPRMERMLEAQAYIDAAMMLLPGGPNRIEFGTYPEGTCWAYVYIEDHFGSGCESASTPALAIASAVTRARAALADWEKK